MNYDSLIMPAGSDYQAAIQHPDLCFKDEELASSSPIKNANGLPSSASGRFAIVFPLKNHSKSIAVRCFIMFPKDQEKRYTLIDKALKQAKLPFFVDFTYKEEGIYLKNKWYPVLKMDWIEGKLLDQYIFDNKESPDKLEALKNELLRIFKALKKNSIAHCDLQPGNIIVTDKGIKLVDYDGLYVPGMEGMTRNEMGTPNYQHPALTTENFNEEIDEFSIWTILLSITALQLNSRLLTKKTFERDYILFQQSDFKDPDNSRIFKELKKIGDQKFQKLLEEFSIMCKEQMLEEYAIDHNWSVKIRAEKKPSTKTISAPDSKVDRPRSSERAEALSEKRMSAMVYVEKGNFTMGDTWGGGESDEKPTHKVTFTYDFYMGKHEATFNDYDAFCNTTGRRKPEDEGWGRGTRPVINVSWWDAIAYCNWLSEKEQLPKAYDNKGNFLDKDGRVTTDPSKVVGYRLPTEAEWEYAARGGNKSKGYKYSGSDTIDEVAWYDSNSGNKTQEVGKKAPNELGIYDMSGNVWEWCSDWYDYAYYSKSPTTNPYNSTVGSPRVRRGGNWYDSAPGVRVAVRFYYSPTRKFLNLGFRICRTVILEERDKSPYEPYNLGPSNKALNQPKEVKLSWECSDPDGNPLTYDIYFDTNPNPTTKISTNHSGKTLNRSNLSYGTTYYWKVVAKNSKGTATEGPVWRFSTQGIDLSSYKPPIVLPPMVLVEKGSFTMGDTWGEGGGVAHTVAFTYNFYIGKYETAFDEYDIFCEDTLRSKPDDQGWERGQRPAINISWWDAIAYCNWLSEREGLPVAYRLKGDLAEGQLLNANGNVTTDITKVVGYRLPTEAEWEYAARGGKKSRGYKYSGSDNEDNVAWYNSNSGSRTQEVGKKAPNELGIYDMSGNVWEWCSDWYDYAYYSKSPTTNPYNSTTGSNRVIRGGSCYDGASNTRVAARSSSTPTNTRYALGFRIARTEP